MTSDAEQGCGVRGTEPRIKTFPPPGGGNASSSVQYQEYQLFLMQVMLKSSVANRKVLSETMLIAMGTGYLGTHFDGCIRFLTRMRRRLSLTSRYWHLAVYCDLLR
jgi:hypothetical protein